MKELEKFIKKGFHKYPLFYNAWNLHSTVVDITRKLPKDEIEDVTTASHVIVKRIGKAINRAGEEEYYRNISFALEWCSNLADYMEDLKEEKLISNKHFNIYKEQYTAVETELSKITRLHERKLDREEAAYPEEEDVDESEQDDDDDILDEIEQESSYDTIKYWEDENEDTRE